MTTLASDQSSRRGKMWVEYKPIAFAQSSFQNERAESLLLMLRKKPPTPLRLGVGLVPGVMTNAFMLSVANVDTFGFQHLAHLARLRHRDYRICSAVKDP